MKATRRQLAMLRSLRTRKGRRDAGLFLVEGVRLCSDLRASEADVALVLFSEQASKSGPVRELAASFRGDGAAVVQAPDHQVQRVSDTVHSQGIVAAARWTDRPIEGIRRRGRAVILALDGVADPGNVGTIIRTAAWFGVTAALLGEGCADLLNPKTVRSTMGGLFHAQICREVNLPAAIGRFKERGFRVTVAAADGAPSWRAWADAEKSLLVLGSEARGVSGEVRDLADRIVAIERLGAGESLNVAVSAGALLSALAGRR